MKCQVLSDLHLEFHKDNGINFLNHLPVETKTVILAGDICSNKQLSEVIPTLCKKWKKVIFVAVNHEYYNSSILTTNNKLLDVNIPNFYWLNMSKVYEDEVGENTLTIHGGTLWFKDSPDRPKTVNDFAFIKNFIPSVYSEHKEMVTYLRNEVKEGDLVVTHHSPSYLSQHERFKGQLGNCWFHNSLEELIGSTKPAVWIHGHIHHSVDYVFGNTRIISNPFGYKGIEENQDFNPELTIEI